MDMRAICVFAGLGGGSHGLETAGFEVVLAIDNSLDAKTAHESFFPSVTVDTSDLTKTAVSEIMITNGIDPATFGGILLCSPPCQGLANCGKRDPEAKTNNLLGVAAQISSACPNAWLIIENVRGLLALRNRPRLLELLSSLKNDGRDVPTVKELRENWVLNAESYNVAQHRERVFIVAPPAWSDRIPVPSQTTFCPPTLGSVIGPDSGFIDPDPRAISLTISEAVCNFAPAKPWVKEYFQRLGKKLTPQSFDRPCGTVTAHVGHKGTGRVSLIHPKEPRLLSIGERMAAFGFPLDRGPIPAELVATHRLIGNAIVPAVVKAIALRIKDAMEEQETSGVGALDAEHLKNVFSTEISAAEHPPFLVMPISGNKKIGECATTYASQATCPSSCIFRNNGCYAETGKCAFTTDRLNSSPIKDPLEIARLESAGIDMLNAPVDLRVHTVGDCPTSDCAQVIGAAMTRYERRTGRNAWTYTHAWRDVPMKNWDGANVLASCETIDEVKDASARGYATSIVIPEHQTAQAYMVDGIKFVPCPEQTRGTTCQNCRMCMRAEKLRRAGITIVFSAHGQETRRVKEIVGRNCPVPMNKNDTNVEKYGSGKPAAERRCEHALSVTDYHSIATVDDAFAHIFDREHQINLIQSAIDAAHESGFENRFHCILHGPPGCGKTDILNSFEKMLGPDQVLKLDATMMTQSGAANLLLGDSNKPKFLIMEEIEKAHEHALRWLLGVLDNRAEIRNVNCNTGLVTSSAKLLCLATANDIGKFDKLLAGALASRFAHKISCPRPHKLILNQILLREIEKIGGNPAWAEPALKHCMTIEKTNDPRRLISVCLSGRDKLLNGEFQKSLAATAG